jgi:KilA-N domain
VIRKQAGLNSFILTAKRWIESTAAIGLISKPGRYGGTYAHKDIAFEFASWVSVEFKLYLQMGLPQGERLQRLNAVAIRQMRSLTGSPALVRLASLKGKGGDLE